MLVVLYPKDAAVVKSCAKRADELTIQEYGWHKDGSEANAFRHSIWNALMTRTLSYNTADCFATAHEETDESGPWNHHTWQEHKDMDLHNNEIGRSVVKWYEFYLSDKELVKRVKAKKSQWMILVDTINCSDCY